MIPDWAAKPTDVPYASFGNPQSLNLYNYVNNNPTTTRDPDGHETQDTLDPQAAQEAGQVIAGVAKGLWNMVAGTWNTGADLLNALGRSSGQPYMEVPTLPMAQPSNVTQAVAGAVAQTAVVVGTAVAETGGRFQGCRGKPKCDSTSRDTSWAKRAAHGCTTECN